MSNWAVMKDLDTLVILSSEAHAVYWVRVNNLVYDEEFGPGQMKEGISIIELAPNDRRPATHFSLEEARRNDTISLILLIIFAGLFAAIMLVALS